MLLQVDYQAHTNNLQQAEAFPSETHIEKCKV